MNESFNSTIIIEKSTFENSTDGDSQGILECDKNLYTSESSEIVEKSSFDDSISFAHGNQPEDNLNVSSSTLHSDRTYINSEEYCPVRCNSELQYPDHSLSPEIIERSFEEPSFGSFSALSPILRNDSPLSVDIYDFEDNNSPPPVRAPTICSDDLYEDKSSSSDSDVVSIVSSALQTSGSSTDSLPFGHLEYENPVLTTSTPLKQKGKGTSYDLRPSILLRKKVSSKDIKQSLNEYGCGKRCLEKKGFTRTAIKTLRLGFWGLGKDQKIKWMKEKLNDFQSNRKGLFKFKIQGKRVCRKCWLQAYGIPKSSFYRYKSKWTNDGEPLNSVTIHTLKEKKQTAIVWLGEYIAKRGEHPPHKTEVWLPFGLRKKEVYNAYRTEQIVVMKPFISNTSFFKIWNDFFGHVRMRPTNLFTKCTVCVKLDRALQSQMDTSKRQAIFREKQEHLHRVMIEKLAYYRRREISRRRPDRFVSLIIDGMDQTKTSLPHFKDRKGKDFASTLPMKTHISAVISHGTNQKMVFSDFYQYKHDSNLTLNILMKVLWDLSKGLPLPPVLYIQADNCFRENKNKYILSFLELLVKLKVFYEVQLSFLQVGHTHEDIDQMFSVFSDKLTHSDAVTLDEFHRMLYDAKSLESCYDISGWLEPFLAGVKYHTKSNIFRFRLDEAQNEVNVYYKRSTTHQWKTLKYGFFKRAANGSSLIPTGQPSILLISLERIDITCLRRSFQIWKCYLNTEKQKWWTDFIEDLEKMDGNRQKLLQKSRKGCHWKLHLFKTFNREALDKEDHADPLPSDLRQMINTEQTNEEIIVRNR